MWIMFVKELDGRGDEAISAPVRLKDRGSRSPAREQDLEAGVKEMS